MFVPSFYKLIFENTDFIAAVSLTALFGLLCFKLLNFNRELKDLEREMNSRYESVATVLFTVSKKQDLLSRQMESMMRSQQELFRIVRCTKLLI